MWSRGTDPDNAAIPYLTAVGDLLGTAFLAVSFIVLNLAQDSFLLNLELDMDGVSSENVTIINLVWSEGYSEYQVLLAKYEHKDDLVST